MTIALPKDIEERLREEARRRGMDAESYAATLLASTLPPRSPVKSLGELFDQIKTEQWTDDPVEIRRRAREEEEFMETMNRNRLEMEGPNARKLYP